MENGLKAGIGAFIFLVIGIALLSAVADSTTSATQAYTVSNESFTSTIGSATQLDNTQLSAVSAVRNNISAVVAAVNYTTNLDKGLITLTDDRNGTHYVDYTYYQVKDSTSRTVTVLVIIFFAIAVMLGAYSYANGGLREAMENFRR